MPTRRDRSKPDKLHILPHPRPPIDPAKQPFVGNESVDDNLAELAQVAMWNAIGAADRGVRITIKNAMATLSGELADNVLRDAVEKAIAAVPGVGRVKNLIKAPRQSAAAPDAAPPPMSRGRHIQSEPFVYVTRFCGLEEASVGAAIRGAVAELDGFLSACGESPAESLIVVYRNRLPAAVTLDIGVPAKAAVVARAGGDLRVGATPGGPVAEIMPEAGISGVLSASDRLVAHAGTGQRDLFRSTWQRFEGIQFRPWRGHVPVPVMLGLAEH